MHPMMNKRKIVIICVTSLLVAAAVAVVVHRAAASSQRRRRRCRWRRGPQRCASRRWSGSQSRRIMKSSKRPLPSRSCAGVLPDKDKSSNANEGVNHTNPANPVNPV